MSEINVVIEQVILLLIVGLIGYAAGRAKYLPASSDKIIAALVAKVTAPLMIVTQIYGMGAHFKPGDYINGVKIYFFAITFILTGYVVSLFFRKTLKINGAIGKIFSVQSMFGNVLYLAIPVFTALSKAFPDVWGNSIAYALFFVLGNDTLMWTVGISLLSDKKHDGLKMRLKHLLNGNSIAFIIGIILLLTGARKFLENTHFTSLVMGKLTDVGSMTSLLSILFIGLMLSKVNISAFIKDFRKKYSLLISAFTKLLFVPILAIFIIKLLNGFLPLEPAKTFIIQISMCAGTLAAALAAEYKTDPEYATQGVLVSTVMFLFTVPVVLLISNLIL